uniref:Peroxin-7 n=1 Tax=Pinguiococcus pyrenoidosus TaxID=172671 RepID=A0A7R9U5K9_9STRA
MDDAKHREIYTFEAPWTIYAMGWSQKVDSAASFRLALGSFIEEYSNKVLLIQQDTNGDFHDIGQFDHPYPATKVQWCPDGQSSDKDLLATTGDYLRLWNVSESSPNGVSMEALLNNKISEYCAPLTSFDWNEADPNLIGTSSIDTTCTIWDIVKQQAVTQLIAHDKEVYDIAFSRSRDLFASVGADGSVRYFDMRSLEHSTILFESRDLTPLLRVAWNKQDPNYIATFMADSNKTIILDIRVPSLPVAELGAHHECVNAIAWAPHSSCHICTAADDVQALIWDLSVMPKPVEDPILAYQADGQINQLQWSQVQPDWIAIAYNNKLQLLRV